MQDSMLLLQLAPTKAIEFPDQTELRNSFKRDRVYTRGDRAAALLIGIVIIFTS